jgi:flagellar hook assembly protein FlgD
LTYIDPTSTGSSGAAAAQGSQTPSGLNQLDNSQTFLNLLVAQLKNQDPDNPSDPTAFMTEIAQLTSVQSQTRSPASSCLLPGAPSWSWPGRRAPSPWPR